MTTSGMTLRLTEQRVPFSRPFPSCLQAPSSRPPSSLALSAAAALRLFSAETSPGVCSPTPDYREIAEGHSICHRHPFGSMLGKPRDLEMWPVALCMQLSIPYIAQILVKNIFRDQGNGTFGVLPNKLPLQTKPSLEYLISFVYTMGVLKITIFCRKL